MTWTSDCGTVRLYCGDCLDVLPTLEAGSVDAVVTDPPYGLSFMGKHWDHGIPGEQFWREVIRVAKPGCHLLAFGGTRTYHRLACAIEDAGWEVRDCLGWIYGSGFPKSLDVSKAIDKMDASEEQERRRLRFTAWVRSTGVISRQIDEATGTNMGGHYTTAASQPAIMAREHLEACRFLFREVPEWVEQECDIRSVESRNMAEREVVGQMEMTDTRKARAGFSGSTHSPDYDGSKRVVDITAPATDAAKQWQGWGTALKPAWEPIILARKPLVGTVAANVLEHGAGAINVDGCRVPLDGDYKCKANGRPSQTGLGDNYNPSAANQADTVGRWPANLIHDGSDEVLDVLGEQSRFFYSAKASKADRDEGCEGLAERLPVDGADKWTEQDRRRGEGVTRHPSRNHHPTVKPTDLMRWLVRLVTPPGGTVLDPFMGSGSTGKAARLEGFRFIGVEREAEYHEIAKRRIEGELKRFPLFERVQGPKQGELFQ